ncbi:apolipoprotein C-I-like [Anabas testudineus]|uniref:Apolipoprotein C-I n=1 Tax=Anabas testudineus TaxID=64144 RepID=A0A7N5ZYG6_ANATE|nr:apolipoprotein C-I-like [Anabas testudineus]
MRLYLAVAVLVLACVAYAEAQDKTLQQRLSEFGEQIGEIGRTVAEKAKDGYQSFHNSEFVSNARNWLQEQMEKVKTIGKN